ncbi:MULTISPECIES: Uma2 family endonuclease [unclassified Microcoleus]|uniref:Uma2 family endonuclease n=1 Tax=unclassified Microcoleus TaxID=2642155 RepID=UPI002FCE87D3
MYYEQENNQAVVPPDIYVVFGFANHKRDTYKVWEEGGLPPDFVLEITSATTQTKDQESKPEI